MTFELKPKECVGGSDVKKSSKCRGPEVGISLCVKREKVWCVPRTKKASVAEAE